MRRATTKKTIPEKIIFYCDVCNKELVDYVDYNNTGRLIIKPTREHRKLLFFRKEPTEWYTDGISYKYKEMLICGECYKNMVEYVKEKIKEKNDNGRKE